MDTSPYGYAARLADVYARRGAPLTLRRTSHTDGPSPLVNPPRVKDAYLAAPAAIGDTSIQIGAASAAGRLLPGDGVIAISNRLVITTTTAALSAMTPGFASVGIQPAPAPIAQGTPLSFTFASDMATFGLIESYPISITDGDRIRARDLQITIAAYGLPDEIPPGWSVITGFREMSIVSAAPTFMQGEILSWRIQARI